MGNLNHYHTRAGSTHHHSQPQSILEKLPPNRSCGQAGLCTGKVCNCACVGASKVKETVLLPDTNTSHKVLVDKAAMAFFEEVNTYNTRFGICKPLHLRAVLQAKHVTIGQKKRVLITLDSHEGRAPLETGGVPVNTRWSYEYMPNGRSPVRWR